MAKEKEFYVINIITKENLGGSFTNSMDAESHMDKLLFEEQERYEMEHGVEMTEEEYMDFYNQMEVIDNGYYVTATGETTTPHESFADFEEHMIGSNKIAYLKIQGKVFKRFLYDDAERKCGDCGAVAGEYHYIDCDMERCPKCKCQLISCDCGDIYLVEE